MKRQKELNTYFRRHWEPAPAWVWLAACAILLGLIAAIGFYLFFFDIPDDL